MPSTDPSAADGSVDEHPRGAKSPEDPAGRPVGRDGSFAFPRDARLLNGRAYDAVFGDNRRVADRLWTVLAHRVPNGGGGTERGEGIDTGKSGAERAEEARLGLAIAKKRARRAVDRNRIKRVARESFRHARATLAGYHVVVMNRDAATTASTAELRTSLDAIWSRLLRQSAGSDVRGSGGRPSGGRPSAGKSSGKRSSGGSPPGGMVPTGPPSGSTPPMNHGSGEGSDTGRSEDIAGRHSR